jgi:hypothetical protein
MSRKRLFHNFIRFVGRPIIPQLNETIWRLIGFGLIARLGRRGRIAIMAPPAGRDVPNEGLGWNRPVARSSHLMVVCWNSEVTDGLMGWRVARAIAVAHCNLHSARHFRRHTILALPEP